jgi:hypothetical protein
MELPLLIYRDELAARIKRPVLSPQLRALSVLRGCSATAHPSPPWFLYPISKENENHLVMLAKARDLKENNSPDDV